MKRNPHATALRHHKPKRMESAREETAFEGIKRGLEEAIEWARERKAAESEAWDVMDTRRSAARGYDRPAD